MDGCWMPDDGLVEKVRLLGYPIRDMSDADRVWAVVNMSAIGWTAQEIADRMDCSLRLIRNIKAEHAADLATYALHLRMQVLAIAGTCRLEVTALRTQVITQATQIDQLRQQRSQLICQLQLERGVIPVQRSPLTPRKRTA